ncbi:N-acetylglucosamine kinase [Cohnella suwonensis]|uniref:N-acetylglucosamine kinase n=1 Tax=Cohnella suwonensis TaxID=696072 RepID=A0ABW0LVJ6_9BACL
MPYYLGVDAGGSKTHAAVADAEGRILGFGKSGYGNHQSGRDEAFANIRAAVGEALSAAGLAPDRISLASYGLAGADREPDYRILRPFVRTLGIGRHEVVCDTMIALRAGTPHSFGIALICGTGTNCGGRSRSGEEKQIGGFGYLYGDMGGGADLAAEAFRSVVRAWEGRGPSTSLTAVMLDLWGYPDVETMVHDFLDRDEKRVPLTIVPRLFAEAASGDRVSAGILERQGEELGATAQAMIRKLDLTACRFDVVLAGSVAAKGEGEYVTAPVVSAVARVAPLANVVRLKAEPVVGAILRAMDADGVDAPYERLKEWTIG